MLGFLSKLIDSNDKEVKRLQPLVGRINALEPDMEKRSDEALRDLLAGFRRKLEAEEAHVDDFLPETFAAVREASRRALGQRHYDVQLMGGMVLHQGKIAEMKTGEGKTLVATLPVTLNALTGRGVHVVTVNDYLAKRDAQWMGRVYHLLGLSVGIIQHDAAFLYDPTYVVEDQRYTHLRPVHKRDAYAADITYGTNNEFGFDYLRDNMAVEEAQLVQGDLHFAIVDEVDNILIDEARTPLIISGQAEQSADQYRVLARLAPGFMLDEDYLLDERTRAVTLTESGIAKAEEWLKVPNLYDPQHYHLTHFVETALKAHVLYQRDKDYIVKDGEVIIVDEFTGRMMPGRRWSDGLHQAVEAKENVEVQRESLTMATITFQNYFRQYEKLAGMTGTAVTEAEEFNKIYKLDVVVIPTHRANVRKDTNDLVFKTAEAKFKAVVEELTELHEEGRPVLVGTVTVETSEYLSELLKRAGVPHQVLNAKFHEREAEIVTQAGRLGAVTIATNMAGRGTDILLGGNPEGLAQEEAHRKGIDAETQPEAYAEVAAEKARECAAEREQVVALGGLHILGTERHESRRIDNQLRGRAGRQGDPGSSRFYLSLDDEIMRRFGGDRIKKVMEWAGLEDDVPIEAGMVNKSIENAQSKVEAYNFDIRKHVVDYDDVMNTQRTKIYEERNKVLQGSELKQDVQEMVGGEIESLVNQYLPGKNAEEWDTEALWAEVETMFPDPPTEIDADRLRQMTRDEVEDALQDWADERYEAREETYGPDLMRMIERIVLLRAIDSLWVEHLTAMENMRQGIGLRAYAQTDPLVAYKQESFKMYGELRNAIEQNVARTIFRVEPVQQQPAPPPPVTEMRGPMPATSTSTGMPDAQLVQQPQPQAQPAPRPVPVGAGAPARPPANLKLGRNDPCWCGSGKKFKRCHGGA